MSPPSTVQRSLLCSRVSASPLHYSLPFILAFSHPCSPQEMRLQHVCSVSMPGGVSASESCWWAERPWPRGDAEPAGLGLRDRWEMPSCNGGTEKWERILVSSGWWVPGPTCCHQPCPRNSPNSEPLMGLGGYWHVGCHFVVGWPLSKTKVNILVFFKWDYSGIPVPKPGE